MTDYDNTNSGALFKNKKREHDNQPTHTGSINIEGKDYWLSAWVKTVGPNGQNPGDRFFSLALNAKVYKLEAVLVNGPKGDYYNYNIKGPGPCPEHIYRQAEALNAKDGSSSSQSSKEAFEGDNFDEDVPF